MTRNFLDRWPMGMSVPFESPPNDLPPYPKRTPGMSHKEFGVLVHDHLEHYYKEPYVDCAPIRTRFISASAASTILKGSR